MWIDFVLLPHRVDEHLEALRFGILQSPTATKLVNFLEQAIANYKLVLAGTVKLLNPQLDVYKEGEQVVSAARILMNEDECTGRFFFGQNMLAPVDHGRAVTPYNDLETMDSKNKLREALCNNGINIKASITSKRLGHNVFRSTVEFRRMSFTGGLASSKKQAERNACAVAVKWLNDPANTSEKNKKLWGTSRPRISLQAWKAHLQSIRDEKEEKRAQRLMDEEMEEEKSRKETMRMIKEEAEKLR